MAVLELLKNHFSGGAGVTPNRTTRYPDLRTLLAALVGASGAGAAPGSWWATSIAVAANTVTLPSAGRVTAVDATTATAAGGKTLQVSATPAAGAVQVTYDADGIPTLTFNAADAVTECAVQQLGYDGNTISVQA